MIAGAALAELSLLSRIDSDLDSLILLDETETDDASLDPILREIASEPGQHNVQYWIERLAPHTEMIINQTLERLVDNEILKHHAGEFWTLAPNLGQLDEYLNSRDGTVVDFVRTRISKVIFKNEIPDPRDVIIISLVNTCDVFNLMFELEEESEARIAFVCKLDVISRSIIDAVAENVAAPLLQRPPLSKPIPKAPMRHLLLNRRLREGNLPALFADLAQRHGPVFELSPPFQKERMIVLAGEQTNQWAHRHRPDDGRRPWTS